MTFRRLKLVAQGSAVGLVVGLLALLVWKLTAGGSHHVKEGARVPNFALARLDAPGKLSLASFHGKVVVLNFWQSYCDPCKAEARLLESAWRLWRGRGVVFLGIDQQDFKTDARRFLERYKVTYPIVRDGPGALINRYGITGWPETYIVRRDGRLFEHIVGQISSKAELDSSIRHALES